MSTTTVTRSITCPMHEGSCGEMVEATITTKVTVAPCSDLLAQGWTGPQGVWKTSQADRLFPAQTVVSHRDGLVTFG